jgi:glycosyltransferase involved in cell wall biosynthesis
MHEEKKEEVPIVSSLTNNVLMVAGFRGQKDHITALKALKIIISENKLPNIHFTFAGDGPKRSCIEQFINENKLNKQVTLVGETKEIDKYYDNCDIVILPTYYEGLPLSLLEAIQKGKPVIATDTGGINEIVQDGVNGNLLAVEDAVALAKHLSDYYINNKIPQLSVNAKMVYDTHYSYNIVCGRLNAVIEAALQNSIFTNAKSAVSSYALQHQ